MDHKSPGMPVHISGHQTSNSTKEISSNFYPPGSCELHLQLWVINKTWCKISIFPEIPSWIWVKKLNMSIYSKVKVLCSIWNIKQLDKKVFHFENWPLAAKIENKVSWQLLRWLISWIRFMGWKSVWRCPLSPKSHLLTTKNKGCT